MIQPDGGGIAFAEGHVMFRALLRPALAGSLGAFALLAASACSYGSAVDIAPMKARLDHPVIAAGDYCEVKGTSAPFTVVSSEDCVPITWNAASRTFSVVVDEDPTEKVDAAIVPLGSDLHAAQIDVNEGPARYQIHLIIAKGDAFVAPPLLSDEELKTLSAKHRKLTFKAEKGRPYVAGGDVKQVKAFLKDAGREGLRIAVKDNDEITVGVLDVQGTPDHVATAKQTKDIEAVLKATKKLTPK